MNNKKLFKFLSEYVNDSLDHKIISFAIAFDYEDNRIKKGIEHLGSIFKKVYPEEDFSICVGYDFLFYLNDTETYITRGHVQDPSAREETIQLQVPVVAKQTNLNIFLYGNDGKIKKLPSNISKEWLLNQLYNNNIIKQYISKFDFILESYAEQEILDTHEAPTIDVYKSLFDHTIIVDGKEYFIILLDQHTERKISELF